MFSGDLSLLRFLVVAIGLPLLIISQSYWLLQAWRLLGRFAKNPRLRLMLRSLCVCVFGLLILALFLNFRFVPASKHLRWRSSTVTALTGLWLTSAMFAFLAVQAMGAAVWVGGLLRRGTLALRQRFLPHAPGAMPSALANLHRRRFVKSVTVMAAAAPFVGGAYGFAFERLRYQIRESNLRLANLPKPLEGLRIAQLSDIHMGNYMSASEVRRAVDMTNALGADLAVVTGDFITGRNDPLESCIAELSRLRAPLGVWGCNGNHEIYAGVEAKAATLFGHYGMRLLRQQSDILTWRGQSFNLIGVDYQVAREPREPSESEGPRHVMLAEIEPLVRRDMPNILLSHNPNSFRRAAELGIELMLTGHTHGGQVRVEILDNRFNPARFLTPYIAGLYQRPMHSSAGLGDREAWAGTAAGAASLVYVNRGLGTIAMPIRLGVPPEITLHTLTAAG